MGDLMAFNSPPNKTAPSLSEPPEKQSLSPGNNPFDTLLKVANDVTCTPTVNETNLLDVAFVEGATFVFTQTFSSDTKDCNRESLGILHINFNELNDKSGDDVFLKDTLTVQTPHKSSYHSFLKSISSRSSQSSQPSTIYSIPPLFQNSRSETNLLNFAMSPSLIEKHLKTANSVVVSPRRANSVSCFQAVNHLEGFRRRISSGPCVLNKEKTDLEDRFRCGLLSQQNTTDCFAQAQRPDEDKDGSMEDLDFVEIRHTAAKIADGSILEETTDSNMLDSTPAPKFEEIENIPEETKKCDTEKVLKMIDRMLPSNKSVNTSNDKSNSKNSSSGSDNLKVNCSQHSAKEAIQNLQDILNNENFNEKRKTAGQHLLKSLVGILCDENNSEDISSLNDSGHSSIEAEQEVQEKGDCYEVLDLRKKSNTEQAEALDLSVGAKKLNATPKSSIFTRRASISLKEMNKTTEDYSGMVRRSSESSLQSSKNQSVQSNQTGSSNASGASLLISKPLTGKIKFKKISVSKTGPVKAVVGLTSKISTPKTPKTASGGSKIKKTSTPVTKSKMKPIAQSTPEDSRTSDVSKKKFEYSMSSPLSRPVSSQHKMSSDPNLVSDTSDQKLNRSNSATNVKNKNTSTLLAMRRSFSSGKGVGVKKPTTETDKLKISNARKGPDENVLNRSLYSRPFSLLSKLKKGPGKENAGH